MIYVLASAVLAQQLYVGVVGDSTALGYAAPYTPAFPAGMTYIRNGLTVTVPDLRFTGIESGFFDCVASEGYTATLVVRAVNGTVTQDGVDNRIGLLVSDFATLGVDPDLLVVSYGTNDAKKWAPAVGLKVFGPMYDAGGPYPGSVDRSIVGQARDAWGQYLYVLDIDPYTRSEEDWFTGVPADALHPYHRMVRAELLAGCAADPRCTWSETEAIPLADGVHPDSLGFYEQGERVCGQLIHQVLLW